MTGHSQRGRYVTQPTSEIVHRDRKFWRLSKAEKEARRLNAQRVSLSGYGPSFEWRAVNVSNHGRKWQLIAFQNRLEKVDG